MSAVEMKNVTKDMVQERSFRISLSLWRMGNLWR